MKIKDQCSKIACCFKFFICSELTKMVFLGHVIIKQYANIAKYDSLMLEDHKRGQGS